MFGREINVLRVLNVDRGVHRRMKHQQRALKLADARDEMVVMVELRDPATDGAAVKTDLERRLKEVIGVRVTVEPAAIGALDKHTGTSQTSKIKRLLDRRK